MPAILKVLLGAMQVTVFRDISSDKVAIGVYLNPGNTRSQ